MSRSRHLPPALAALVALVTLLALWPGFGGGFLFDDYANLPSLGAYGPVHGWPAFWRYVTSGSADPTGRPIALLSFLLDARDWPAPALPFKRTNVLLHLLCGLLLFRLLANLGAHATPPRPTSALAVKLAALMGAALWLLHPLFVSTTLYIVQREAMLSALFMLAGLLLWLRGRQAFHAGRPLRGWAWLLSGLGGFTLLAVLSKANGLLLPALALVIEHSYLAAVSPTHSSTADTPALRSYGVAMRLLAGIPAACLAGYLMYEAWQGLVHGISSVRPWTLAQRLITEPRVLMEYLKLLWLPRPYTTGVFNDQYPISTTLGSPATTLPALLAVLGLLVAAWRLRNRTPAIALAIAFFFVGQSMESSTIALELYFEHRNYLPAMLMFWPLALWLCGVPLAMHGRAAAAANAKPLLGLRLRAVLATAILMGLAWMTHARADLWGNTQEQAMLWAKLNPNSPRAQAYAAQAAMQADRPELAVARLQPLLDSRPDEVQLALNLLAAHCQQGRLDSTTLAAALQALHTTRDTGTLLASWFGRAIDQSVSPACPEMNLSTISTLLDAAQTNPRLTGMPGRLQDIYYLRGRIALARKQPDIALGDFNAALDQQVRATAAFQQAALLGSAGYPHHGLAHLQHYQAERTEEAAPAFGMPRFHAWLLERQRYWDIELLRLRETLREDARNQPAGPA